MQALVRLPRVFSARTRIVLSCISLLSLVGMVAVSVVESKLADSVVNNEGLEGKALAANFPDSSTGSGSNSASPSVLGVNTLEELMFKVSVPAVFSRDLTAPNVLYSVTGSAGIRVGGDEQSPTLFNTGVLSLNTLTGDLELEAGSGIEIDGLKISNAGILSIAEGTGISVSGNEVSVDLEAGNAISIDGNKISSTFTPDYTQSGWKRVGTVVSLTNVGDGVEVGALSTGAITSTGTVTSTGLVVNGGSTLNGSLTVSGLSVLSGSVTIGNGAAVLPSVDLGSDLGSDDFRFNNLWVGTINSNSSVSYSGQTKFTYEPQDATYTESSVMINPTTSFANGQLLGLGIAGYQRALIDEDGDLVVGYNDQTSAPTTDYPLNVYGHSGTRVSFTDTTGNAYFGGKITSADSGSQSTPTYSWSNDTNTGMYRSAENEIAFATNGGYKLAIGPNDVYTSTTFSIGNYGTATSPALKFVYDSNTGIYHPADDSLAISTAGTERLRVDASGNVGIGTTSMGAALQIGNDLSISSNDASSNPGTPWIRSNGNYLVINSKTSSANMLYLQYDTSGGDVQIGDAGTDHDLYVYGNVGIGTTNPSTRKLHIYSNGSSSTGMRIEDGGTGGRAYDIVSTNNNSGLGGGKLIIYDNTGSASRLTIDSSGNVGIGTTAPSEKLEVSGNIKTSSLTTGTVYSNAGVLTNTDPSDSRLKNNIVSLSSNTLERVLALRAVSFNWNNTGDGALGFIAQEVRDVFPELVGSNGDTLGLYTTQFIPVLTKAIQQQQLEIDEIRLGVQGAGAGLSSISTQEWSILSTLVSSLKGLVDDLVARLGSIESKLTGWTTLFVTKKSIQEELCVGDEEDAVCLDKDQLRQLMEALPDVEVVNEEEPAEQEPTATPTPSPSPSLSSEPTTLPEEPSATPSPEAGL